MATSCRGGILEGFSTPPLIKAFKPQKLPHLFPEESLFGGTARWVQDPSRVSVLQHRRSQRGLPVLAGPGTSALLLCNVTEKLPEERPP